MKHPENKMRRVPVKEACAYGRMSRSKLYRLIADEKILAYKDVHMTLIDLNSIDAYHASLPRRYIRMRKVS